MTPEHRLMNEIRLWCGEHNYLCFRCNVGTYLLANGQYMDTGLPKGFSDLMIADTQGHMIFCECKIHPNKPSKEQVEFLNQMRMRGFRGDVFYSLDQFIRFVEG